jgi:4a-hydroxytetrahydrobiopterin dehydratase
MNEPDIDAPLTRTAASNAVADTGWRYLFGLSVSVPVASMAEATTVAAAAVAAGGIDADEHLRVDLRPDRVEFSVQSWAAGVVTGRDTQLAHRIAGAMEELGLRPAGATSGATPRPVQAFEMAIDANDIEAVRPFWKAVMGYVDAPDTGNADRAIVDPAGQLPPIWFQPMDVPRVQRNRVHFDIIVAHDEADTRIKLALDAGGRMVNDSYARSFWVLADAEGNEICVCTWTDRDERDQQTS